MPSESKRVVRDRFKAILESFSFNDLIEKSFHLRDHFLSDLIEPFAQHTAKKYVVSFFPFTSEPQINIEDESQFEPFKVAYVRIVDWKGRLMECRKARRDQPGQWEEITPVDGIQIFQPTADQELCRPDEITLILVPGLAFTKNGERLGRGAGFYDRFLATYPHALRVGVAFKEQICDSLPTDSHDQLMDVVLTDQTIISTNRFSQWQKHGIVSR